MSHAEAQRGRERREAESAERQRAQRISQESWRNESWPGARASHGNVNEDNFDDCFRYWEIRSLGVREIYEFSVSPKLQAAKANKRNHKEVIGKVERFNAKRN